MKIIGEKIRWIDIQQPAEGDINWLQKNFSFHPLIIKELKKSSARSKVDAFDDYLYLIYHLPVYDSLEKVSRRSEIDFLLTKNDVITVHYDDIEVFSDFQKSLMNEAAGRQLKEKIPGNTLKLTYELLSRLINFHQRQLNHVEEEVEDIGNELFKNKEKELLKKISYAKRNISEYQLIVKPQQHLFSSFLESGSNFWGKESRVYLADLAGEYLKLLQRLESSREAVTDFETTNNQLMDMKTNEIMKTFTILAFSTFPLVLLAGIFSMKTAGVPLTNNPAGFWIVVGIMAAVLVLMFIYFKRKRWL